MLRVDHLELVDDMLAVDWETGIIGMELYTHEAVGFLTCTSGRISWNRLQQASISAVITTVVRSMR